MKKPIVLINLKTYKQGKAVVNLCRKIEDVVKNAIVGVQPGNIYEVSKSTRLKVYSEHVDWQKPGRNTGYILPESVKADKAVGSFLNHSEHKLKFRILKRTIKRCRKIGLKTAVFAASVKEAKKIEKLKPTYLIYEPPELVGGRVSVSKAKPEIIKSLSEKIKMPFLVGAGIKTKQDVKTAMELGASGIGISSVITKSKNPKKVLKELIK